MLFSTRSISTAATMAALVAPPDAPARPRVGTQVSPSPMYGAVARLRSPQQALTLAVWDGARIVSWRVDGRETGFVGRVWGGDMFSDLALNGVHVSLRTRRVSMAETIRDDRTGVVGVRTIFELTPPEVPVPVSIERTVAIRGRTVFLDVRIRNAAGDGTPHAWYTFAPHLLSRTPDGGVGMLHYLSDAGEDRDLPLNPKTFRPDKLPVQTAEAGGGTTTWQSVAVTGPAPGKALVFRVAGPGRLGTRAYASSVRLDFSLDVPKLAPGEPAVLRACWDIVPIAHAPKLLRTPPGAWPALPAHGTPITAPRGNDAPPVDLNRTPLAVRIGPWGACLSAPRFMPILAAAGVRWVRANGFGWGAVEPTPGKIDYSAAEALVTAAHREGVACIGLLHGSPGWATVDGDSLSRPRVWKEWEAHVERTVRRFRGRVHIWEIWNEPDIRSFWHGTASEYVSLLRHAYRAAKRADPNCLIMSAGLDGGGEEYLVQLLEHGAAAWFDLVGAHPYAGTAALAEYRMRVMQRILNFYNVRKPLWITEIGWQSGGWKSGPGVVATERIKAVRLATALPVLARQAEVVCWYRAVEPGRMFGLLQPAGEAGARLQAAWFAMRELALDTGDDVAVSVPERVVIEVGRTVDLTCTVENRRQDAVTVRWLGLDPDWGGPFSTVVPPGTGTLTARIKVPTGRPPHERDLVAAVQRDGDRRHIANAVVHAKVTNAGPFWALLLSGGWVRRLDADGKPADNWRPINQVVLHPGDAFIQPLRPRNGGSAADAYTVTLGGTAAPWIAPPPKTVRVAPGKVGWIGLRVQVPPDAAPGTYTIQATVRSSARPQVQRTFSTSFSVRRASGGTPRDANVH